MIYFDHGATSFLKPPQVARAMTEAMKKYSSVGRGGYPAAMGAAKVVHQCREEAGNLFQAEPEQVVFTMNATHGLNIAIQSLCKPGMAVAISGYEHNGVLRPLYAMGAKLMICGRKLFKPEEAIADFERSLTLGAELVVCTCCSNVFGYVLPYDKLSRLCAQWGVPLILDASQGAGILPISLKDSGAAFIAMPGHKGLYGPQGTGILLCGEAGAPLFYGGTGSNSLDPGMPEELPDRLEAGTHNVCGIAGLLEGIRYVKRKGPGNILRREQNLTKRLMSRLEAYDPIRMYRGEGQTGVLSFTVRGRDPEDIAHELGQRGIAVRAGLHCAPLAHESAGTVPSGTIRISLSDRNQEGEVDRFAMILKKIL